MLVVLLFQNYASFLTILAKVMLAQSIKAYVRLRESCLYVRTIPQIEVA